MKKKSAIYLSLAFLLAGVLSIFSYGDDSDPIISKSYLDKRLKELHTKIEKIEKKQESAELSKAGTFAPVQFKEGQRIVFSEGAEFLLRAGEANIVDPTGNGLADLTQGANLQNGAELPLNHTVLCPRADGRGVAFRTDSWIMVKGTYSKANEAAEELQ